MTKDEPRNHSMPYQPFSVGQNPSPGQHSLTYPARHPQPLFMSDNKDYLQSPMMFNPRMAPQNCANRLAPIDVPPMAMTNAFPPMPILPSGFMPNMPNYHPPVVPCPPFMTPPVCTTGMQEPLSMPPLPPAISPPPPPAVSPPPPPAGSPPPDPNLLTEQDDDDGWKDMQEAFAFAKQFMSMNPEEAPNTPSRKNKKKKKKRKDDTNEPSPIALPDALVIPPPPLPPAIDAQAEERPKVTYNPPKVAKANLQGESRHVVEDMSGQGEYRCFAVY